MHIGQIVVLGEDLDRGSPLATIDVVNFKNGRHRFRILGKPNDVRLRQVLESIISQTSSAGRLGHYDTELVPTGELQMSSRLGAHSAANMTYERRTVEYGLAREVARRFYGYGMPAVFEASEQ